MMRPMKLGGEEILFGQGVLEHLKTLKGHKAFIVTSGDYLFESGHIDQIVGYLKEAGMETKSINYVEPDPSFETAVKGAKEMLEFQPDWIIGLGGGSAMDAAKAMWVLYEHPEVDTMEKFAACHNNMPQLRKKARMVGIPTTSGTASEVSRSTVITNTKTHEKSGASDMQLMPDVVLLEPGITAMMPKSLTAATGMDALTHAIEAYTSTRANMISDTLAEKATKMIMEDLVVAYNEGENLQARENMLVASCIAGMAFTNVSLGITHSIAHTIGGIFGIPHGLADAVILPYVVKFNMTDESANNKYKQLANILGKEDLYQAITQLNKQLNIPVNFKEIIKDDAKFDNMLDEVVKTAIADGCTKTNPIVPSFEEMKTLVTNIYYGG